MRQLDTVAISEFLEPLWQVFGGRHPGGPHQNRNNRDIPPQGGSGFDANEIRGIVETPCSALVFRIEPFWAHYYQEHATLGDAFFNRFTEVASRFDAGHIHKYHVFAEMLDEIVKQTTSLSLRVTPSIADKDSAQLPLP
jgi:hypothetical protein